MSKPIVPQTGPHPWWEQNPPEVAQGAECYPEWAGHSAIIDPASSTIDPPAITDQLTHSTRLAHLAANNPATLYI